MNLKLTKYTLLFLAGFCTYVVLTPQANAEPGWARKYNANCTLCHTIYPRLNRTGYEFKRLGYRFPAEVEARLNKNNPKSENPSFVPSHAPTVTAKLASEGKKIYTSSSCDTCHSIGGKGASVGPALDGVGSRQSANSLKTLIASPPSSSAMPPTTLSPAELDALVAYLQTLQPAAYAQTGPIPRFQLQNYIGVAYSPAIEMMRSADENSNEFSKRDLAVYLAGTVGFHFSFFVQPLPLAEKPGLVNHFEMIQGNFNYGNSKNFMQIRFGQMNNFAMAGFAGADRSIGESMPLIYMTANSFNPGEMGRGVSVEYTFKNLTTLKAFSVYQTPPDKLDELPDGSGAPEARRSRTYGFVFEKVVGKKGLSGVQVQYAGGDTPLAMEGRFLPALRFQRLFLFANKTFQDKKNVERLNLIAGAAVLHDSRLLSLEASPSSNGYGYFFEANWIPVRRLGVISRFDVFRPTTRLSDNLMKAETATVTYDFVKYARMLFEYQHVSDPMTASNSVRIGWQFNF